MDKNYIDEMVLLKAFIDHGTLSYTEVQERGFVPSLNKQDRRISFKNTIDKFRRWELIEPIPDSDPRAWNVIMDKATIEYNKLVKEIEQKRVVEKYSFVALQDEVRENTKKLKGVKIYRFLAVTAFTISVFQFFTGLSFLQIFAAIKRFGHFIIDNMHL
jgi:hypothetical protein